MFFVFHLNCHRSSNLASFLDYSDRDSYERLSKLRSDLFFNIHPRKGSIDFALSRFEHLEDIDVRRYLLKAQKCNPYEIEGLLALANSYLRIGSNVDSSLYFLKIASKKQSNYFQTNLLLAEIYLIKEKYSEVRSYLNLAYHSWYKIPIHILERKLYLTKYINAITKKDSIDTSNLTNLNIKSSELYQMYLQNELDYNFLAKELNDFESILYNSLDSSSYLLYLNDLLECRISSKFDMLISRLKLEKESQSSFYSILKNYNVQIEYYRRKLRFQNLTELEKNKILHLIPLLNSQLLSDLNSTFGDLDLKVLSKETLVWNWYFQAE